MSKWLLLVVYITLSTSWVFAGKNIYGEKRVDLSGYWQFKTDPEAVGKSLNWQTALFDDSQWDKMAVPGSWELTNPYSNYIGQSWYRTTFNTPTHLSGQIIFLEFEAVSMSYQVYVNGQFVAEEAVGNYIERFDITSFLNESGKNTLAVMVDNSVVYGAYCNWGGIRRPVNLCVIDPVYTLRQEIVAVPDLKKGSSAVCVKAFLENKSSTPQTVELFSEVAYKNSANIRNKKRIVTIPANTVLTETFDYVLTKQQTKLWDIDHPNLYVSKISVSHDNKLLNTNSDQFGIRKIEILDNQFLLNGKSLRLAGYNWVADDRTSGITLPEWRYKEDIDRMKRAGANMARLSHRPLPEDVMDYLDEVGFLTVSEFNNWQPYYNPRAEEPRIFARKLIHQQYNHPGVIGWSVGNEMGNWREHVEVNGYVDSIIKYIKKELDPNRFVLYVSNTADYQDNDAAQYCDFIMINKYSNYQKALEQLKQRYPNKPVFVSEYGGYKVNLTYDTPNNTQWPNMIMEVAQGMDHVFGFSVWTFNDYRSLYQSPAATSTTPIHQNRQWGIVDVYRNKKRSYEQVRQFYAPIKALEVTKEVNKGSARSVIKVSPRDILDIPSFELVDYSLVWEVRNKDNKVMEGGIIELPKIIPGSQSLTYPIQWTINDETAYLKVALISPVGYSVADKRVDVSVPLVPEFQILQASNNFRIVFEPNDFANEYYVKYVVNGSVKKTKMTIDHYIDLPSQTYNVPIEVSLVAVNGAGESESEKKVVTPCYGYQELPPIIWQVQPCDQGFFVGQGYFFRHYYYVIRYTTTPEDEKSWKYTQNRNLGMAKVSGLENGVKYYFQIANTIQYAGKYQQTIWSEMKEVTPSKDVATGTPLVHGVVRQNNNAVFVCSPARNGAAYELKYTLNDRPESTIINRAEFEYVVVKNIGKGDIGNVELKQIR
jgi:hypothetical protein